MTKKGEGESKSAEQALRRWAKAPVAPYFVLRFSWRAIDRLEPKIDMHGFSWIGWMAGAPSAGWEGLVEEIQAMAPAGAAMSVGAVEADARPEPDLDMLAPILAPGSRRLWIGSEESVYHDIDSERIRVLDVVAVFGSEDIPRQWSKEWDCAMSERALGRVREKAEAMLSRRGFAQVEFMGRHEDISGPHCWSNVAVEMSAGWTARALAAELDGSVPEGVARKQRPSI